MMLPELLKTLPLKSMIMLGCKHTPVYTLHLTIAGFHSLIDNTCRPSQAL